TRFSRDWSSDVCSSDLEQRRLEPLAAGRLPRHAQIERHAGRVYRARRGIPRLMRQRPRETRHHERLAARLLVLRREPLDEESHFGSGHVERHVLEPVGRASFERHQQSGIDEASHVTTALQEAEIVAFGLAVLQRKRRRAAAQALSGGGRCEDDGRARDGGGHPKAEGTWARDVGWRDGRDIGRHVDRYIDPMSGLLHPVDPVTRGGKCSNVTRPPDGPGAHPPARTMSQPVPSRVSVAFAMFCEGYDPAFPTDLRRMTTGIGGWQADDPPTIELTLAVGLWSLE